MITLAKPSCNWTCPLPVALPVVAMLTVKAEGITLLYWSTAARDKVTGESTVVDRLEADMVKVLSGPVRNNNAVKTREK